MSDQPTRPELLTVQGNGHGGFQLVPVDEPEAVPQVYLAYQVDAQIADMAWLITNYEIVYDPGSATKEERERANRIFLKACEISPPEEPDVQ